MKKWFLSFLTALVFLMLLPTSIFAGAPADVSRATSITCRTYVTGSEAAASTNLHWTTNDILLRNNYDIDGSSDTSYSSVAGVIKKFKVNSKGTLELSASALSLHTGVTLAIYRDSISTSTKLTSTALSNYYLNVDRKSVFLPKSGTYYLVAYNTVSNNYPTYANFDITVKLGFAGVANKTLPVGKYLATSCYEKNSVWYKIRPTKTGYITVTGKNLSGYITLCNSKKNVAYNTKTDGYINTNSTYSSNSLCFGVKANTTYYIRVENSAFYQGFYCIKYTNTKQVDAGGTSKSKAKTMKRNSTYRGNVLPGNESDWFKVTNTTSKNIQLIFTGKMTGRLKITVYKGSQKTYNTVSFYNDDPKALSYYATYPSGTYYIKIEGYDKKATGKYSVKWTYR